MIEIKNVKIETAAKKNITYEIETDGKPSAVTFSIGSYNYSDLDSVGIEPAVLAVLSKAMLEGHIIKSKYQIDPVFLSNLGFYVKRMRMEPQVKSKLWLEYIGDFKKRLFFPKIEIKPKDVLGPSTQARVGLFYSGGVDSTYSLITCGELSEVIHVENFNSNYQNSERAIAL